MFYYHWQKPSSVVELQTSDQLNCDSIKLYWLTDYDSQGRMIVSYLPSMTVYIEIVQFVKFYSCCCITTGFIASLFKIYL